MPRIEQGWCLTVDDAVADVPSSSGSYSLGHSQAELDRLTIQGRLIEPITRRFFVDAGIRPGMRVLDVGSGAGDVALLARELVGPDGDVVGTDRASTALVVARERARSLTNVTFLDGDPSEMSFPEAFDAVVGRYVLMHQPDPAAVVRNLLVHVRPGGIVVFHEPYRAGLRSFPPLAAYDRGWELVDETFRRSGADPLMGIKLHATFVAAGLPPPSMRMESVIAGGASCSDVAHFEMDVVGTLVPEMERLGVATADEAAAETLVDRVIAEAASCETVLVGRCEVGAWSRLPAD
jgi:SAM-dependent methyltransferase